MPGSPTGDRRLAKAVMTLVLATLLAVLIFVNQPDRDMR
jgi:hypothetical protein